ncbi:MAG: flagellar transcriptional regulator FlhC [Limnobacter sp.]|uniref:flagellar transcriptional regulator FlhC n=1 Tax=Limnobacter sp. TaxID=2003368 RepID=UPI00391C0478
MAKVKSILSEAAQIQLATELIKLDARLQVLESETQLSRERLLKLYKELKHKSPPKGMLPFSTDWFMTWQPNIHSSLFINIYQTLIKSTEIEEIEAIIKAYRMYMEQVRQLGMPEVLSLTRAWRLVKFFDAGMLTTTACTSCDGHFVVHTYELVNDYVCGLCHMPSRAGKTRQSLAERFVNEEADIEI